MGSNAVEPPYDAPVACLVDAGDAKIGGRYGSVDVPAASASPGGRDLVVSKFESYSLGSSRILVVSPGFVEDTEACRCAYGTRFHLDSVLSVLRAVRRASDLMESDGMTHGQLGRA